VRKTLQVSKERRGVVQAYCREEENMKESGIREGEHSPFGEAKNFSVKLIPSL
jgi:hypothetical protein